MYNHITNITNNFNYKNYDVIGFYAIENAEKLKEFKKSRHHGFRCFSDMEEALMDAKRLSVGGTFENGAFYVGLIGEEQYLVFRCVAHDKDARFDYLTTIDTVSQALKANQNDDIPWFSVEALLQDYESDKTIGDKVYSWLSEEDILATRDSSAINKLELFNGDTRITAFAF